MKKKVAASTAFIVIMVMVITAGNTMAQGINNPKGFPLYVIIEVNWDGTSPKGDWTVWGPKWEPVVNTGTILSTCTYCLEMNYDFTFRGKTVSFDEPYVPGVEGHPQIRKVLLLDIDGDGTYTGSLPSEFYTWPSTDRRCMDRIDYEISFDEEGNCLDFHYLQYEHCQPDTF